MDENERKSALLVLLHNKQEQSEQNITTLSRVCACVVCVCVCACACACACVEKELMWWQIAGSGTLALLLLMDFRR